MIVVALALAVQNVRISEQMRLFPRLMAWVVSLPIFSMLAATLILALVIHPSSGPARLLSRPSMMWIGRLSYSLYLWHNFALEETKHLVGAVARTLPFVHAAGVELPDRRHRPGPGHGARVPVPLRNRAAVPPVEAPLPGRLARLRGSPAIPGVTAVERTTRDARRATSTDRAGKPVGSVPPGTKRLASPRRIC